MKAKNLLSVSVMMAMFGLAGCGNGGGSDDEIMSPTNPEEQAPETTTIVLTGRVFYPQLEKATDVSIPIEINQANHSESNPIGTTTNPVIVEEDGEVDTVVLDNRVYDDSNRAKAQYAYARYYRSAYDNQAHYAVASFGIETPETAIPTGQITYEGAAFAYENKDYSPYMFINNGVLDIDHTKVAATTNGQGKVSLTADFDTKQLTGLVSNIEINSKAYDDVQLAGQIEGNRFASADGANVLLDGAFYGPQAESAAGAFLDKEQNLAGGFTADQKK
ncbi:MAG: transferrin-binding protein-like solute binding protein [Cardiobacteriaceae bacterium]|nr:transferrin-binding protein-like solute binding protein [Cardiobacteriaceae bacterium]